MSLTYEWALLYRSGGRDYVAERFSTFDPNEARRNHERSCEFHWVRDGMDDPLVTDLEAVDERGRVRIRESCRPGQDPKRVYKPVPRPANVQWPV